MTWAPTQSFWALNNRPTVDNCVIAKHPIHVLYSLENKFCEQKRGLEAWQPAPLLPYHSFIYFVSLSHFFPLQRLFIFCSKYLCFLPLPLSLQVSLFHSPVINSLYRPGTIIPHPVPHWKIMYILSGAEIWGTANNGGLRERNPNFTKGPITRPEWIEWHTWFLGRYFVNEHKY